MNRLFLIARREYLSYVATWGFWISLATVPLFMAAGFIVPQLFERSTPERAYVVIADDPAVGTAIEDYLDAEYADEVDAVLGAMVSAQGGDAAGDAYDAARENGAAPLDAAMQAGLAPEATQAAADQTRRNYVRVEAPERTVEGLRPYLTGARQLDTPEGPRDLHAALFVEGDAQAGYSLDYWSANLSNQDLMDEARRALGADMADAYLRDAGVDPAVVAEAEDRRPETRALSPEKTEGAEEVTFEDRLPYLLGVGAGFVLWSILFSVANMLLTSTIEEKGNKILDSLLASARLTEILAGKLLGVAGVSFTLLAAWIIAGLGFVTVVQFVVGGDEPLAPIFGAVLDPGLLLPFAFYFVVGYLMYGAVFMAIGSLCETIQEAQTFMSPLIIILMIPLAFLVFAAQNLDSSLLAITSWIPPFTPFLMIARLPTDPPLWEIVATSALMLGTMLAILLAASAVFRMGALGQAGIGNLRRLVPGMKR